MLWQAWNWHSRQAWMEAWYPVLSVLKHWASHTNWNFNIIILRSILLSILCSVRIVSFPLFHYSVAPTPLIKLPFAACATRKGMPKWWTSIPPPSPEEEVGRKRWTQQFHFEISVGSGTCTFFWVGHESRLFRFQIQSSPVLGRLYWRLLWRPLNLPSRKRAKQRNPRPMTISSRNLTTN